jgi:ABC-type histidine transport system ATPase subunit
MAGDGPAALTVQDLHKRFGSLEVLKGVSLTARNGDVISMIGSSGSGRARSCAASTCSKCRIRERSVSAASSFE